MTETEAFAEFHKELKLDPDEVAFARGFPDEIREALAAGGVRIASSFLQGSLARGTMVSPLRDVDMVVCLDRDEHGELLVESSGSDRAMAMLETILDQQLRTRYPELKFGARKPHAVAIVPGDDYPSFDLVPAFETTTEDDDVLIADREDDRWERSNTRELIRVIAKANKSADGRLIHVVRMVKHAVTDSLHDGFPGLVVESFAVSTIVEPMPYADACALVFEAGASMLGGPILDPTGRDDLAPRLESKEPGLTAKAKEWFEAQAANARRAQSCAESGEYGQAIAWWHRIFGEPFPSRLDTTSVKAAATALTYGTGAVRPNRAWRRSA